MAELRLGILGMSDGNGHPYSWSAIINGYEPSAMAECGYAAIPTYLAKQKFPDDRITGARITHVWTQDKRLSRKIAEATYIENVVNRSEDMIGHVDAVLLARDDAENHRRFAEPFIEAGLPIYIDKPFALSKKAAEDFFALERKSAQIFSCSALRYAKEMLLTEKDIERIGDITHISAHVPKSWNKYAIHVIDPILKNCGPLSNVSNIRVSRFGSSNEGTVLSFAFNKGKNSCEIKAYGNQPSSILIEYIGAKGSIKTVFNDSFSAFKSALEVFINDSVYKNKTHANEIIEAVEILELGLR